MTKDDELTERELEAHEHARCNQRIDALTLERDALLNTLQHILVLVAGGGSDADTRDLVEDAVRIALNTSHVTSKRFSTTEELRAAGIPATISDEPVKATHHVYCESCGQDYYESYAVTPPSRCGFCSSKKIQVNTVTK